jgi:hypothetical protein
MPGCSPIANSTTCLGLIAMAGEMLADALTARTDAMR